MNKTRNMQMDIVKGIAIILIVLGHTGFPGTHFVYLFHLAIFYFVSGYFFKDKYSENINSVKKYIFDKIKRLYLPYLFANVLCILCNNVFIYFKLYSSSSHIYYSFFDIVKEIVKKIFLQGQCEMVGATWFLPTLLLISIIYCFNDYFLKKIVPMQKNIIQFIVGVIFLIIGYILAKQNINIKIFELPVLTCYILFDFGVKFSRNISQYNLDMFQKICIIFILIIGLSVLNQFGSIELSKNCYTNVIYFLTVSIMGCVLVYEIAYFISKLKFLNRLLQYIGQESLIIMIGHLAVFKLVNVIGVFKYNLSIEQIARFPVAFKGGYWWIIYTSLSIALCIFIKFVWIKIKQLIIKRKNNI